jgi:hypothetical protein
MKKEENPPHDAFAEMFIEEFQVINRQPSYKGKESQAEDPLVVFAYCVLLPIFFASLTILGIIIWKTIFGG